MAQIGLNWADWGESCGDESGLSANVVGSLRVRYVIPDEQELL